MKQVFVLLVMLAAVTLIAVPAFGQGMYVESSTSGGPMGSATHMSKSYLMPKMFKTETEGGEVMVIRADKEMMFGVKPADKTYWQMTFTELEATMKQAKGAMDSQKAEMKERMKGMTEEQRKQMEGMLGMMGGDKKAKVEVVPSSEKKQICGYSCTKTVITSDGKELVTLWVAKGIKGFDALKKDWEAASKRMMALNPMNGAELADALTKLDGYPLETDAMGMTSIVTKIENRSTPASAFEVPAGYTKTDSPMKKGMEGRH